MTNKQHDIFISYSRKDIKMMYKIRDALRAGGAVVWTDEYITPYTKAWEEAIEQAIGNSSGMVVLCSPESKKSDWVNIELTWAKKKGLDIFLYLISGDEETSIPFGYIRYQYTDARDDKQPQALKKLVDTIKERYGIIGIAELQEEIRDLTAKYKNERQRVLDLQQELKEAQSNAHNTDDLLAQVTQATTEIANLRAEIRTQKQRTRILQKSLDDLADAKQQEADALNEQLHTEQQRIVLLEYQLVQAQDTHPDVGALHAQLAQSVIEIEQLKAIRDNLTRQIDTLKEQLADAQQAGKTTQKDLKSALATINHLKKRLTEATIIDLKKQVTITDLKKQLAKSNEPAENAKPQWVKTKPRNFALDDIFEPNSTIRRLHTWNPMDWFILLWWILVTPNYIKTNKNIYGYDVLEGVGNWLFSTLTFLPLSIPLSSVSLGLVPITTKDLTTDALWILLVSIIGLWLIIGLFGKYFDNWLGKDNFFSLLLSLIGFVVVFMVGVLVGVVVGDIVVGVVGGATGIVAGIVAVSVMGSVVSIVTGVVAVVVAGGVAGGMAGGMTVIVAGGFVASLVVGMVGGGMLGWMVVVANRIQNKNIWAGRIIFGILPLMYALLIWVYYFGGWRVFMPMAS